MDTRVHLEIIVSGLSRHVFTVVLESWTHALFVVDTWTGLSYVSVELVIRKELTKTTSSAEDLPLVVD